MVSAGNISEDHPPGSRSSSVEGLSSMQQCQSIEEWRSCEQVENGTPSTSPPYWDSDDDDDSGPKPSDLYGKFTWKIENFSQISKRELRSNAFEVGGYKWYILIYPQGCDACNHLSLFLCVANHDKLLPGWSHFALFTIAVVNKDPKKNKYNDTLHRFCKKEHDWGWKKFMELNKVMDGFVADDTLTIKAQVQVIREKAHRPFRCLDCQYRRELIRVYLSAVEKTCAEFVNERRQKLQTLIGDRAKWSSFHAFWLGIDPNTRRHMSRDRTDAVLKVAVKHFFIEKEVLSTLVMDSLYSGLRALESQSKMRKPRASLLEKDDLPAPVIFIENDMFVLADDVFRLLERASLEFSHLPLPSKEEKGLPTRAKDGCSGDEFSRDSILRDERRLTELGRRTLEIFVLAHIFSRIEIAYQEAVALKRQEELIREEEEEEQAENEKRERRAKKKQARQRRNNRKAKDRGKDEKSVGSLKEKHQLQDCLSDARILEDFSSEIAQQIPGTSDLREGVSDVSDLGDDGAEVLRPDIEDRDSSPLSWDTDISEINPTAEACTCEISNDHVDKKSPSIVDDSSSTCSTDSVPSIVVNGPYKGKSTNNKNKRNSSNRGKSQQNKDVHSLNKDARNGFPANDDRIPHVSGSCSSNAPKREVNLLKGEIQRPQQQLVNKKELEVKPGNKIFVKDQTHEDKDKTYEETMPTSRTSEPSSSVGPSRTLQSNKQSTERCTTTRIEQVSSAELASNTLKQSERSISRALKSPQSTSISKVESLKHTTEVVTSAMPEASSLSRPSSASGIAGPKPTVPFVSASQRVPQFSRTLGSIGGLDSEPSFFAQTFEPQSYRNAIMGVKTATGSSSTGFPPRASLNLSTHSSASSQGTSSSSSSSVHVFRATARKNETATDTGFSFGSVRVESLHEPYQWIARSPSHVEDIVQGGDNLETVVSSRLSQGAMPDEFPHLDIINDLLDEDRIVGGGAFNGYQHQDDFHPINQQYSFPGDLLTSEIDSLNNSYQYDVPDEYYYDEMSQMVYDSFVPFHAFGDLQPLQLDFSGYGNGMDGLLQNQWPVSSADLSILNYGSTVGANGYSYQLPEYSSCGVGGYNMMYQPSNGI